MEEPADLCAPGLVFQIGVAPLRIDILTAIDGLCFEEAWLRRVPARFADQPAAVLSTRDLLQNKRASGRPQDLVDAEWLERQLGK